ncbi:MAG: zinc-binding dehydrogenase [Chloroflexota bacterium]
MRTAVLTPRGIELREQPQPTAQPGLVLVRSLALGICEGDVFHYREMQSHGGAETLMGHEGTGTVAAVGPGVTALAPGALVTALGGPYAELFAVPVERVAVVPPNVDPTLALGEPLACCVHAANRFGVRLGDRVAIIGSGFMGLACLQLARLQGAAFLCALEPIAWRREMALRLGAEAVADPLERSSADLLREYGEFDVVIEATGVPGGIDLVGDLVRQHGRVVLVGYHQTNGGLRTVNMKQWNFKAIDVINGHVRRDDEKMAAMRAALALVAAGRLDVAPLVTAYPLAEADQAFRDLAGRKEGLYKAVLVP